MRFDVVPRHTGPMLDIRLIRSDPDGVRAALERRGPAAAEQIDHLLELDERWRALTTELETLRAEQNQTSRSLRGAPTPNSVSNWPSSRGADARRATPSRR